MLKLDLGRMAAIALVLPAIAAEPALPQTTGPGASAPTALPVLDVSDSAIRGGGFVAPDASTGSKTATPIAETPQSISVVPRAAIDARQASPWARRCATTPASGRRRSARTCARTGC